MGGGRESEERRSGDETHPLKDLFDRLQNFVEY